MHQAGWHLRQLLYTAGRIPQLEAQGLHGPLVQDAVAQVQLLQVRVGAEHKAEVPPPFHEEGLTLCPVSARGRSERKYGCRFEHEQLPQQGQPQEGDRTVGERRTAEEIKPAQWVLPGMCSQDQLYKPLILQYSLGIC